MTQTCDSMPARTAVDRPTPTTCCANSAEPQQLNAVFSGIGFGKRFGDRRGRGPSPLGYCSVAKTGTFSNFPARAETRY